MYGLVLSGGGAKGAYQIGVWKALKELDIDISFVCGTSVGALNGAFIAQGHFDEAYDMWSSIGMEDVFEADESVFKGIDRIIKGGLFKDGVISTGLSIVSKTTKSLWHSKGVDISPLRKKIDSMLDENLLRNSKIGFGLVAVSLSDRKALRLYSEDIPQGELKYYLLGSALIPGFTQDSTHHKKFIDGGVFDNFPVKMAYDKGYRKIIGVDLFPKRYKGYKDAEVTYISPSKSLGNILYFNEELAKENIELGYLDTMKVFGKTEGNNYFFTNVPTDKQCFKILHTIPLEEKRKLCKIALKKDLTHERMFNEKVIPRLAKELHQPLSASYQDIIIDVVESALESKDINMYQVLDFKKVIKELEFTKTNYLLSMCEIVINSMKK